MPAMLLSQLPAELIDHIFSFLRRDIPALKSCSQTHPLFKQLAERYIYAEVVLGTSDNTVDLYKQTLHILDYIRSFEIHTYDTASRSPIVIPGSIMPLIIPRMANLMSLKLCGPPKGSGYVEGPELLVAFQSCIEQSSVEHVCLCNFYDFPLSILDNGRRIKKLTLSDCIARSEPISKSPRSSLEALRIRGYNRNFLPWTMARVTNLTSLQLQDVPRFGDWSAFLELLTACSPSLRRLGLDAINYCQNSYFCPVTTHNDGHWSNNRREFPFTLSAYMRLKQLSISARVHIIREFRIDCGLPAIMRLVKTAPAIQDVDLRFHWECTQVSSLGQMDWSPLVLNQSDFPGVCPRIHLFISSEAHGHPISPESILDALAKSEILVDLVKRNMVTLKPEGTRNVTEWPWTEFL